MALGEQAVNRAAPKRFSTAYKYSGLILETVGAFLGPLQRFKNANEGIVELVGSTELMVQNSKL